MVSSPITSPLRVAKPQKETNVILRIAPPFSSEEHEKIVLVPQKDETTAILHSDTPLYTDQTFQFSKVYHTFANNGTPRTADLEVHSQIMEWIKKGTKPIINCLAFGGSFTGKTHTLFGGKRNIGVAYLLLEQIFEYIDEEYNRQEQENIPENDRVKYAVKMSCLELYDNEMIDLTKEGGSILNQANDTDRIRLHPELEVFYVEGMRYVNITSYETAQKFLHLCLKRRHLGKFSIPDQKDVKSNKGHVVLDIIFEKHTPQRIEDDRISELLGHARGYETAVRKTLVRITDTAASYEPKHSAYPQRASKEDIAIQKGVTAIQKCINAMGNSSVIPYRESPLTYLLRDVFTSKTPLYLQVCARPENQFFSETSLNLRYAQKLQNRRDSQPKRPPSPSLRRRSNSSSSLNRQRPRRSRSSSLLSSPGTPRSSPGTPFDRSPKPISTQRINSPTVNGNSFAEVTTLREENQKLRQRVAELEEQMRNMKTQKMKFVRELVMLSKEYKDQT